MKYFIFSLLLSLPAFPERDISPDSPLDSNMEEVIESSPQDDVEQREEVEREKELLENPYDVPDENEEEEYNHNGS